jgi:sterol desaturase/sphingolipid hydroxylase (fatty acid hydroxylase superfamily)
VHHASNEPCLDKNYGGMLIIFDRLFGSFAHAPADEPLRYGLVGGKQSFNPVRIALGEWVAMLRDVRKAAGAWAKFRAMFGPPAM